MDCDSFTRQCLRKIGHPKYELGFDGSSAEDVEALGGRKTSTRKALLVTLTTASYLCLRVGPHLCLAPHDIHAKSALCYSITGFPPESVQGIVNTALASPLRTRRLLATSPSALPRTPKWTPYSPSTSHSVPSSSTWDSTWAGTDNLTVRV